MQLTSNCKIFYLREHFQERINNAVNKHKRLDLDKFAVPGGTKVLKEFMQIYFYDSCQVAEGSLD